MGVPYFGKDENSKRRQKSCFGDPAESTEPYRELHQSLPAFILARFWTQYMVKAKTVWHDSLFVMLPVFPAPGCIVTLLDLGRK